MRTLGTQIVPARVNELRRVLLDLNVEDLSQLDPLVAAGMDRPLGRELLAARLPISDSVFICLYNLEPSGLIILRRSDTAAQIRALAVAPDMRRKGLARTMLIEAERRARERRVEWLWMSIPSTNQPAIHCARRCGFRRYCPQYLRVNHSIMIEAPGVHVQLEEQAGNDAVKLMQYWLSTEVSDGDAWLQPLIERDLKPMLLPAGGRIWRINVSGNEMGGAHLTGTDEHPVISLWLDSSIWGEAAETGCLRAVVNTLRVKPPAIDVRLGSEGHLRAALARYKELGFTPVLEDRVLFAKRVEFPEA